MTGSVCLDLSIFKVQLVHIIQWVDKNNCEAFVFINYVVCNVLFILLSCIYINYHYASIYTAISQSDSGILIPILQFE